MATPEVKIAGDATDAWPELDRFLGSVSSLVSLPDAEGWRLDLSNCRALGAGAAVLTAALSERARIRHQQAEILLPTSGEAAAFCELVGLRKFIACDTVGTATESTSDVVPLRQFLTPVANAETQVINLIQSHRALSIDAEISIGVAINEAIQNVYDHANSPVGALMTAHYSPVDGDLRVAITDLGDGIPTVLSRRYDEAQDALRAMQLVFEGGRSSHSRPNNFGLGISNLVSQVLHRRGALVLLSGSGVGLLSPGVGPAFARTSYTFPGTLVCFQMSVRDDDEQDIDHG